MSDRGVRSDATFDYRQFKAIIRLGLIQSLRPARDQKTGKVRSRPLRTMMIAYGLIGFFFIRNAAVFRDLRSYLIVVFSYVLTTAALTGLPDTTEMERRFELVCSKPIGARTMAFARAMSVLIVESILVACLAAGPLFAIHFTHDASIWLSFVLIALMLLGAFSLAIFWMNLMMLLAQRIRIERLRWISMVVFGSMTLMLSFPLILPRELMVRRFGGEISFDSDAFRLLPSAWLVDSVLGDFSLAPNLERVVIVASVLILAIMILKLSGGRAYTELMERALQAGAIEAKLPRRARFVRRLARLPIIGRALFSPKASAVAVLVIAHGARDEIGRRRLFGLQLILVLLVGLNALDFRVATPIATVIGFLILVEGARLSAQSPQAGASWILDAAPTNPSDTLAGLRAAVLFGYFAFPFTIDCVLLAIERPFATALIGMLSYLVEADIVLSMAIAVEPAIPLSLEEQKMPPIAGRFVYMIVFGIMIGVRSFFATGSRAISIYLLSLAVIALLLRFIARRRFAALADQPEIA